MGIEVAVNAEIEKINGFSGHADADQLMRWAGGFANPPKKTFIMHGEGKAQLALKERLEGVGHVCQIPGIGDSVEL